MLRKSKNESRINHDREMDKGSNIKGRGSYEKKVVRKKESSSFGLLEVENFQVIIWSFL